MSVVSKLRKVGGSVMLSIPPGVLQTLSLNVDDQVELTIDQNALIMTPQKIKTYSLDELLRQCDVNSSMRLDDEWTKGVSRGEELICVNAFANFPWQPFASRFTLPIASCHVQTHGVTPNVIPRLLRG